MQLSGKTILVVGASSGIGRQVVLALSHRGNKLVITARRQSLLDALAAEVRANGSECLVVASDALDEDGAAAVVSEAVVRFGRIDVALLNVGDGPAFNMATTTAAAVKRNMQVNYDSMVNYLVPVIQQMKRQRGGLIAHTNSLAGFLGLPMQGPYSAAKAAGRILLDSCRIELSPFNIRVVSLYPGFVATARIAGDGIPHPFQISVEKAAEHIVRGMEAESADVLFPLPLKLLIRTALLLPKPVVGLLLRKMIPEDY